MWPLGDHDVAWPDYLTKLLCSHREKPEQQPKHDPVVTPNSRLILQPRRKYNSIEVRGYSQRTLPLLEGVP